MPKFSAVHYNAIAKEFREELQHYLIEKRLGRQDDITASTALTCLATNFAKRFKEDNDRFDPLKFLDACSPNTDVYPLSELWEDDDADN